MTPEALARAIEEFLREGAPTVALEEGEPLFDFASAKYSLSTGHGKCVLHMWSEARNAVRRVLDAEPTRSGLRLSVQKFGQAKPARLELCRERDRRAPTAKKAARAAYQRLLRRTLEREFPDLTIERLSSAMDLEKSFGPIYTRGLVRRGRSAFAVLGVNAQEMQAAVDAALTFGILWLEHARSSEARALVEGLKLFVPRGTSAVARERMAHLDHSAAKFELYELEEREPALTPIDCRDRGNIRTRLVRWSDPDNTYARFAAQIARVRALVAECECVAVNPAEVVFRLHGLEFARARVAAEPGSFRNAEQIFFGTGAQETQLGEDNAAGFTAFVRMIAAARRAGADRANPLFRMQPERWLESLVVRAVSRLDSRLAATPVYSQVPAFSAADRAMIDVLALTRERRLAVVELKADEDIHLPLQGLDYWARVHWHHQRGEFQQFGYFAGHELSPRPPLLLLLAPALRVHPATDTLLRYLAPEIDCELLGVDERWREEMKVVFRKRRAAAASA